MSGLELATAEGYCIGQKMLKNSVVIQTNEVKEEK